MSLLNHSHWIWSIRYNQFHDQLVLTCSSDSRVNLTRIASLASQPYGHLLEEEDGGGDEDGEESTLSSNEPSLRSGVKNGDEKESTTPAIKDELIASFEEHEDSVYAAEWSACDPWIFASLSYDGRLVINKVPKNEKFNILF